LHSQLVWTGDRIKNRSVEIMVDLAKR